MASDAIVQAIDTQLEQSSEPVRKIRTVISDAFAFIRSQEANAALATVTLEQLISDQILRNGDSSSTNKVQFNPYSFDPSENVPASQEPAQRANFLGGSDIGRPTRLEFVLSIKEELSDVIKEIKNLSPIDVADSREHADSVALGSPEDVGIG